MKILEVPILLCLRCNRNFIPKIDPDESSITIPEACPKRDCRSKTWNIPDSELDMIRKVQMNNLLMGPAYGRGINKKIPVLEKYKPKEKEKISLVICMDCEIFFHDESSLKRHQYRRHHGLCSKCHTSNVYVMVRNGVTICKNCMEFENRIIP